MTVCNDKKDVNSNITKEKFLTYVAIRDDGSISMFNVDYVKKVAIEAYNVSLTKEEIKDMMIHYIKYYKKFFK